MAASQIPDNPAEALEPMPPDPSRNLIMPKDAVTKDMTRADTLAAQPAGPCAMVIFGAGGDLTRRLVTPALYNLMASRLLPGNFALIGVDIADLSTEQWRQRLTDMMQELLAGGGEFQLDANTKR